MKFFDYFKKPRLFVLHFGDYKRVTGPPELLNSLKGLGGYIVIGDEIVISSGIYFSGGNSVANNGINGYHITQMILDEVTFRERRMLVH